MSFFVRPSSFAVAIDQSTGLMRAPWLLAPKQNLIALRLRHLQERHRRQLDARVDLDGRVRVLQRPDDAAHPLLGPHLLELRVELPRHPHRVRPDVERRRFEDLDDPVDVPLHERLGVVARIVVAPERLDALSVRVANRPGVRQDVVELARTPPSRSRRPSRSTPPARRCRRPCPGASRSSPGGPCRWRRRWGTRSPWCRSVRGCRTSRPSPSTWPPPVRWSSS